MSSLLIFAGLDYHLETIRVCVLSSEGIELVNRDVGNDAMAVYELISRFGYPSKIVLEACCGTADFAEELRRISGWDVKLADAGAVQAMKRGPDKTDHGDAFWLADLARVNHVPEVWLPDKTTRELRSLVRYRQRLADERRKIKQHIRGLVRENRQLAAPANAWTKKWRKWLIEDARLGPQVRWVIEQQLRRLEEREREVDDVEKRLEEVTKEDPTTQQLLQFPGIGLVTAVTLRAELGRFDRFANGKQLARYCGVTPCNRSSGKKQSDAGIVKRCNGSLRQVVIETAHRLARWDERWRDMKQRLVVESRKPRSVATCAVANRWLRWLYHQIEIKPKQDAALAA